MFHYSITLPVLSFIVKHVVKNRLEDGEFMKFDVGLYGKNGCYFQTLE